MEDQNKHHIFGYTTNVSPLKISKAKRSYFEFEKQNSTNQLQTVFHLKNEELLKVFPQMNIKTVGVS